MEGQQIQICISRITRTAATFVGGAARGDCLVRISWTSEVVNALKSKGGTASTSDILEYITRHKKPGHNVRFVQHAIRSSLDDLKNGGRVERVDRGIWKILK